MQYTLLDLLKPEHVLVDIAVEDAFSAIRMLNAPLVQSGDTSPEFAEDACARERTFPTGLPTQPVAVAIPHADPDHVQSSAFAVATLHSPVQFSQMGTDGSILLDVHAVFLLAIKETEKQVDMIAQLMKIIQNAPLLAAMMQAARPAELVELIQNSLAP
jgi:PTS system galactitol-specific IIA component